jgi:hypothetical protein
LRNILRSPTILSLLYLSIYSYPSMVLQPFVEPCPFFQFLNPMHSRIGLLGRRISRLQGRYLHTEQHKHRRHPCLESESNPRSQRSSERR